MFKRLSCLLGRHEPDIRARYWDNATSGSGFDVTRCTACGRQLTRRPGSKWRVIDLDDR